MFLLKERYAFPKGDIMKKGIIIASFGTTHEEARKRCIESIEKKVRKEYENFLVLRSFTSQIIIDKLRKENYSVDNLVEALEKMKDKKIYDVYIQPLYILPGKEYRRIIGQVNEFSKRNYPINIRIGRPLLSYDIDYDKIVEGLNLPRLEDAESILLMGHGSDFFTDRAYKILEKRFKEKGYPNIFIGTLKGVNTIGHIIPILKSQKIRKVKLMPFMLVAGRHAVNDMVAGENSWKRKLLAADIQVEVSMKGLGEIESIQDIYMSHLKDILLTEKEEVQLNLGGITCSVL